MFGLLLRQHQFEHLHQTVNANIEYMQWTLNNKTPNAIMLTVIYAGSRDYVCATAHSQSCSAVQSSLRLPLCRGPETAYKNTHFNLTYRDTIWDTREPKHLTSLTSNLTRRVSRRRECEIWVLWQRRHLSINNNFLADQWMTTGLSFRYKIQPQKK